MTPSKILGKYKITYHDGIVNEKWLVSSQDFTTIIQPMRSEIASLEILVGKAEDEYAKKIYKLEIRRLNGELYDMFGEMWFTDNSPLFGAIATGKLDLPSHQGGSKECKVELLTK